MRPLSVTALMKSSVKRSQVTYRTWRSGCWSSVAWRDRLREVRLAEAGVGVDEHRVVGAGRRLRDAVRDGGRVLVVGTGDEAVEDVARVQVAGRASASRGASAAGATFGRPLRGLLRRLGAVGLLRRLLSRLGRARVDHDADLDGVAQDFGQSLGHLLRQPPFDPLAREVVGHADDEGAVVEAERHGPVEPELERGVIDAAAKVLLRLFPDVCELVVRRCPASSTPGDAAAHRGAL